MSELFKNVKISPLDPEQLVKDLRAAEEAFEPQAPYRPSPDAKCENCGHKYKEHKEIMGSDAPNDVMQIQIGRSYRSWIEVVICPTAIFKAK